MTPTDSISLKEIVAIVDAAVAAQGAMEVETPGLNYQYTADNSRLLAAMPQLRFTSYEDGIGELVEFYRKDSNLDKDAVIRDDYARRVRVRQ